MAAGNNLQLLSNLLRQSEEEEHQDEVLISIISIYYIHQDLLISLIMSQSPLLMQLLE